jgi:transglutaminase-like putative cysteine protease
LSELKPVDFVSKAFVKSPEPLENLDSVKAIEYRIKPMEEAKDFKIISSDNQQVEVQADGTVILTVRPTDLPKEADMVYRGSDAEVRESLRANQFIQSNDEKIKQLAKKAVGDTKNASEAVRKIEKFVSEYIDDKNLSVGYASATEVAHSRQGDCTEFAVLTAAVCRAAGIPARIAVGVAYVDEFMEYEDVFGGHAWTEAYVGGKWVGLDSSFMSSDRGSYDAGHIALATGNGELEDFFSLVFSIGQFEIEEITIQK